MSAELKTCPSCSHEQQVPVDARPDNPSVMCEICGTPLVPPVSEVQGPEQPLLGATAPGPNPPPGKAKKPKKGHPIRAVLIVIALAGAVWWLWPSIAGLFVPPTVTAVATSTPTPSPSPSAVWPKNVTQCTVNVAVTDNSKCEFATNVRKAYLATSTSGKDSVTLKSVSEPDSKKKYDVTCTVADLSKCTSKQTKIVVYLR